MLRLGRETCPLRDPEPGRSVPHGQIWQTMSPFGALAGIHRPLGQWARRPLRGAEPGEITLSTRRPFDCRAADATLAGRILSSNSPCGLRPAGTPLRAKPEGAPIAGNIWRATLRVRPLRANLWGGPEAPSRGSLRKPGTLVSPCGPVRYPTTLTGRAREATGTNPCGNGPLVAPNT